MSSGSLSVSLVLSVLAIAAFAFATTEPPATLMSKLQTQDDNVSSSRDNNNNNDSTSSIRISNSSSAGEVKPSATLSNSTANVVASTTQQSAVVDSPAPKAAGRSRASKRRPSGSSSSSSGGDGDVAKTKRKNAHLPPRRKPAGSGDCKYERGVWEECGSDGVQLRVLRLKVRSSPSSGGANNNNTMKGKCEPTKTIRRECNARVSCKYARGDWSVDCVDGLRSRVDRLVGQVGTHTRNSLASANTTTATSTADDDADGGGGDDDDKQPSRCQPARRVIKDCKRTCHYIKSAWSACRDGVRQRSLVLDESRGRRGAGETARPPGAQAARAQNATGATTESSVEDKSGCVKTKLIVKEC